MSIFDNLPTWFGAEGSISDRPLLIRGRTFSHEVVALPELPHFLMIRYTYEATDPSGLPSDDQYKLLRDFERRTIDALENHRAGITAFVKTCNGFVRYALYVADVDSAVALLNSQMRDDDPVELSSKEDGYWSEYTKFMTAIS